MHVRGVMLCAMFASTVVFLWYGKIRTLDYIFHAVRDFAPLPACLPPSPSLRLSLDLFERTRSLVRAVTAALSLGYG